MQELSGAAGEILAAVDQISRGAQMQAAATQQATTAMGQIETAAKVAGDRGAEAEQRGAALLEQLAANRAAIETQSEAVSAALAETRAMATSIAALEEAGRRVEKMTDGIALVAVQTTMLAVSGSVEAARAGEAGRGFAVVSGDIRSLARDAADNADQVKDLVRAIQSQITLVLRDMETVAAALAVEVDKNRLTAGRLAVVAEDVAAIQTGARAIAGGAETILDAVREVLAGTQQIAAAAEEASNASVQAAAAARQQAQSAEDLAVAIEEIASIAGELTVGAGG